MRKRHVIINTNTNTTSTLSLYKCLKYVLDLVIKVFDFSYFQSRNAITVL